MEKDGGERKGKVPAIPWRDWDKPDEQRERNPYGIPAG